MTNISISPGKNNVGAYINDLDLNILETAQIKQIKNILDKYGVVFIKEQNLNSETYSQIQDINYKNFILKVLSWKNYKTSLIRLHTNSNFYNYQGGWHRDDLHYPSPNSIQAIVYLLDEEGFRIVPKYKNHKLSNFGIPSNRQTSEIDSYNKLPEDFYDVIKTEKGDILFMESGLLHQGFCKKKRLHYHIRHERDDDLLESKSNDNFNFTKEFQKDADPNFIKSNTNFDYYDRSLKTKIKRAKTLISYFFPRTRSLINNILSKKKQSIFHSTFWQ